MNIKFLKLLNKQCSVVLYFCLILKRTISYEIDRLYWIGNRGYSSSIDGDIFNNFSLKLNEKIHEQISTPKEKSLNLKTKRKFYKINSAKILDHISNYGGIGKTPIYNPKYKISVKSSKAGGDNSISNNALIDFIHLIKDNRKQSLLGDIPEWDRILQGGRLRDSYQTLFYEVPIIEKHNEKNIIENKVIPIKTTVNIQNKENLTANRFESRRSKKLLDTTEKIEMSDANLFVPSEDVSSERLLGLFEIVTFNNVDCISGSGLKGTCLHALECTAATGTASGICADGFGVCCIFQYSCGHQTSSNCSTFTNPGFPKPSQDRLACTLTINKANSGVKQLRLNIVQMELLPPTNGTCLEDQFVVTGQNMNSIIPIICGINNGQHMYVEVADSPGPFYLSVLSTQPTGRLFQVEVCQLAAVHPLAPQSCLQYHTSPFGVIESFNYRFDAILPGYRAPGYTNNLNYAICISRVPGTCSITYSNGDENGEFEFQILNYDTDGVPLLPPGQAGAEIFNCPDDFIVANGIRLCGERFNDASVTENFTLNAPVTEFGAGPIVFTFRTNGNVTGRGFRLFYRQNLCTMPD